MNVLGNLVTEVSPVALLAYFHATAKMYIGISPIMQAGTSMLCFVFSYPTLSTNACIQLSSYDYEDIPIYQSKDQAGRVTIVQPGSYLLTQVQHHIPLGSTHRSIIN